MSIFGKIASAIFGSPANAAEASPQSAQPVATAATPAAAAPGVSASSAKPDPKMATVDVAAVLDKLDDSSDEDLDWRKSIVDLMKLLKIDSSLKARKELATELHYTGDMNDSAGMNVWLHKQVMTKLAANGGIVPADLKH